ncbi:MAG: septum formation inhibitor Maf [Ilumatobacteraceae bacterium]|nr:septum formation inhibitor Maf [Ilumatobacteraceae bacterium]
MIELPHGVELVLASTSPRRAELLGGLDLLFDVRPPDIDETPLPGEAPAPYVERLARAKAAAVVAADTVVLAADTTVDLDGTILGKPSTSSEAADMLAALSGRDHLVHTGVAVATRLGVETVTVSTSVRFAALTTSDIEWYIDTGEPFDKAGGYGIQGRAASFVASIDGSVTNVIGLPLAETVALLRSTAAR